MQEEHVVDIHLCVQVALRETFPCCTHADRISHVLSQQNFCKGACNGKDAGAFERYKATMRRALVHEVMPAMAAALIALVDRRPHDPVQFLSEFLIKRSDDQVSARVDPYDAPIYAERRRLVAEKAWRDEDRTNASIEKLQREKQARKLADAFLHEMLLDSVRKHTSMLRS